MQSLALENPDKRKAWEQKFAEQIKGHTQDEINRAYANYLYTSKYGQDEIFNEFRKLSYDDKMQYLTIRDKSLSTSKNPPTQSNTFTPAQVDYTVKNDTFSVRETTQDITSTRTAQMNDFDIVNEQKWRDSYQRKYSRSQVARDEAIDFIKKVADEVSPYYKTYKNTDNIQFTDDEWVKLAIDYQSLMANNRNNEAVGRLQNAIQNNVSENQSFWEKTGNVLAGAGSNYIGMLGMFAGAAYGFNNWLIGNHPRAEGVGWLDNLTASMFNNDVSNWASDLMTYGSWNKARVEQIKRTGGLNQFSVVAPAGADAFNPNNLATVLQQTGFSGGSALTGKLMGLGAKYAFKGARKIAQAANVSEKVLANINKVEKVNNAFMLPGAVGNLEGLFNANMNYNNALESYTNDENDQYNQLVEDRFNKLMDDNYNDLLNKELSKYPLILDKETGKAVRQVNPQDVANQVMSMLHQQADMEINKEYGAIHQKNLQQAEYAATHAGAITAYLNSVVNGFAWYTGKSFLMQDRVQSAIKSSRLKLSKPYQINNIANPTIQINKTKKALDKFKPYFNVTASEGGEEYFQSMIDGFALGGAAHNVAEFREAMYNGDDTLEVGDYISGDFKEALHGALETAISKEALTEALYGALGGAIGAPSLSRSNYVNPNTGKIELKRREGESRITHIARLIPWQTGIGSAIQESKENAEFTKKTAEHIQDWLEVPENRAKFDGMIGSYHWIKAMESSARLNDEFGYRNSQLGLTINDALMLSRIKNTEFGKAQLQSLDRIANMQKGSEEEAKNVKAFREQTVKEQEASSMSDTEIADLLRNNAQEVLNKYNTIIEESNKVDKQLGNVDNDTKISIIYGKMAAQDRNERIDQLRKELGKSNKTIDTDVEKAASLFWNLGGTKEKVVKAKEDAKETIENCKEVLKTIKKKSKSKTEKLTQAERDAYIQNQIMLAKAESTLKQLNQYLSNDVLNNEENLKVLNSLDNVDDRTLSKILMQRKQQQSTVLEESSQRPKYYTQEQLDNIQSFIDKEVNNNTKLSEEDYLQKSIDLGKLQADKKSFDAQIRAIMMDPDAFSIYINKSKNDAKDIITKQKYTRLINTTNYSEFASVLDQLARNQEESKSFNDIKHKLEAEKNPNYLKWKEQNKVLDKMHSALNKSEKFPELTENNQALMVLALQYLSNEKGTSWDGTQESAIETLSSNKFRNYITDINSNLAEEDKIIYTGPESILPVYSAMINIVLEADDKVNGLFTQIIPKKVSNPDQDSAPAKSVIATTNEKNQEDDKESKEIRDKVIKSLENNQDENKENKEVEDNNLKDKQLDEDRYIEYAKQYAIQYITNEMVLSKDEATREEEKKMLLEILQKINANESITTIVNYSQEILKTAQALSESNPTLQGYLTLLAQHLNSKIEEFSEKPFLWKNLTQYPNAAEFNIGQSLETHTPNNIDAYHNGKELSTVNLNYFLNIFPNSVITKYIKQYKIKEFIEEGNTPVNTPIQFIYDPLLVSEVQQSMLADNKEFTNSQYPLVAVIEVNKQSDTTIEIEDKHYQPVGIMPADTNMSAKGINTTTKVRENMNIQRKTLGENIDKPFIVKLKGSSKISNVVITPKASPRKSILEIVKSLSNNNIKDFIKNSITGEKLGLRVFKQGNIYPNEQNSNLFDKEGKFLKPSGIYLKLKHGAKKGNSNYTYSFVRIKYISESTNNEGLTFLDVFKNHFINANVASQALTFNPIIQKVSNNIQNSLFKPLFEKISANKTLSDTEAQNLSEIEQKFRDIFNKSFSLSDADYNFTFKRYLHEDGSVSWDIKLHLTATDETIFLTSINTKDNNDELLISTAEFLRNLIIDDNTQQIRVIEDSYNKENKLNELVKWQVSRENIIDLERGNTNQAAQEMNVKSIERILTSDILQATDYSIYNPAGLFIEYNDGNIVPTQPSDSSQQLNKENASEPIEDTGDSLTGIGKKDIKIEGNEIVKNTVEILTNNIIQASNELFKVYTKVIHLNTQNPTEFEKDSIKSKLEAVKLQGYEIITNPAIGIERLVLIDPIYANGNIIEVDGIAVDHQGNIKVFINSSTANNDKLAQMQMLTNMFKSILHNNDLLVSFEVYDNLNNVVDNNMVVEGKTDLIDQALQNFKDNANQESNTTPKDNLVASNDAITGTPIIDNPKTTKSTKRRGGVILKKLGHIYTQLTQTTDYSYETIPEELKKKFTKEQWNSFTEQAKEDELRCHRK